MSRELNPSMLEKRIYDLEKNGGGGGEIEHLTEVIESVDNSLITEVDGVQTHFYLDYKNGKFGMNTEEERGVETFHPFNSGAGIDVEHFRAFMFSTTPTSAGHKLCVFDGDNVLYFDGLSDDDVVIDGVTYIGLANKEYDLSFGKLSYFGQYKIVPSVDLYGVGNGDNFAHYAINANNMSWNTSTNISYTIFDGI